MLPSLLNTICIWYQSLLDYHCDCYIKVINPPPPPPPPTHTHTHPRNRESVHEALTLHVDYFHKAHLKAPLTRLLLFEQAGQRLIVSWLKSFWSQQNTQNIEYIGSQPNSQPISAFCTQWEFRKTLRGCHLQTFKWSTYHQKFIYYHVINEFLISLKGYFFQLYYVQSFLTNGHFVYPCNPGYPPVQSPGTPASELITHSSQQNTCICGQAQILFNGKWSQ